VGLGGSGLFGFGLGGWVWCGVGKRDERFFFFFFNFVYTAFPCFGVEDLVVVLYRHGNDEDPLTCAFLN